MNNNYLSNKNSIETLETRKQELLKRKSICKDPSELKQIEKELKKLEALLKRLQKTEEKVR